MNGLIHLQWMKKVTASMGVKQVDLIHSESLGKDSSTRGWIL